MDMIVQSGSPNTVRRKAKYLNFAFLSGDSELLSSLSEEQRAVLTASGPYKERAEKLGLPIGTVRAACTGPVPPWRDCGVIKGHCPLPATRTDIRGARS